MSQASPDPRPALLPARFAILLLMAAAFSCDLAISGRGLLTQWRAIQWETAPVWLGVLVATPQVMNFVGCFFLAPLSDRLGRRNSAVSGLALGCVALLGHYFSAQVWHLVLFAAVYGLAMSLFWATSEAWFSELAGDSPRGLDRALGNFNLAWSAGMVAGALLGGYMWQALGASAFLVLLVVLAAAAVGLCQVPQPRRTEAPVHLHLHNGVRVDPAVTARYLLSARLVAFFSWGFASLNLTILPKLAHEINMPERQTGLAVGAFFVALVVFFWFSRTSGRWQYRVWPIALPVPLALVGMGGMVVAHSVGPFMVACFIAGASTALSVSTALYYALHGREEDLAHSTALHEAVVNLGGVSGAVLSGLLAEALAARLGPEASLRACFVMAAAVAALIGLAQIAAWKVMAKEAAL